MKKLAIIVGSEGAIGSECVAKFKQKYECLRVDLSGKNESLKIDCSTNQGLLGLVEHIRALKKPVEVLVNAAAANAWDMPKTDSIADRWDRTLDNDLRYIYLLSEAIVPLMAENAGGQIINIGSIAGTILGSKSVPYAAAKAAINGITKSHARLYGSLNIKVNCIAPGIIDNKRTYAAEDEVKFGYNTAIKKQTPLLRWGKPAEIANLIYFIGSGGCPFLTGQTIIVDGGATLTCGLRVDDSAPFKWDMFPVENS
jgi:NAD(P)-dependent dehydrogenase (short-subunit alcohol dehydrogenase family)